LKTEELKNISTEIRRHLLFMHAISNESHIASSLSIVEILVELYFEIMNTDPKNLNDPERDRFILSKGHAASALYAVLAERGYFDKNVLTSFAQNGAIISVHPERNSVPGVEVSTGSLGHGLPIAAGIAFSAKRDARKFRTFVLLSDGECEEGSVWEAAIFASRFNLDNLVAIVDKNKWQAYDRTNTIQNLKLLKSKWEAFGWSCKEVDGHNFDELRNVLGSLPFEPGKPSILIANTVKGKGIPEMEDKMEWHYKSPKITDIEKYMGFLG